MRLVVAEIRKLHRPLTWGVAFAVVAFCVLLAVGGASNSQRQRGQVSVFDAQSQSAAQHLATQLSPMGSLAEAAGLLASMPGAIAMALLAGGHVGGEWSGRTLKHLLTQQGHRNRVIAAKMISLWIAAVGLLATCWLALAVSGPFITRADGLPSSTISFGDAARWSGSQAARAMLVFAFFAAIGLLAAMVTRNIVGAIGSSVAALVVMLVVAGMRRLGASTPATWVQDWMGFPVGQRSISDLPSNFWSRFIHTSGSTPGQLSGGVDLMLLIAACLAVATWIFRRTDVAG
jgi:ABC-type transport system involved in multi-copper enzyme maturation permease subunit